LLCAIQHAEATGERATLDLLLARPHQVATLNASTSRKRLTPLMCAIDLGAPDVVEALIAQGVDVEQKALTDSQSPLYYLVSQLFYKLKPAYMLEFLSQKMMEEPDDVLQDTLRRFGVGMAGTFGSSVSAPRSHPELVIFAAKLLTDKHATRHSVSKLMRIAELLLQAGANPNAPQKYPVPGRTPLMLAAESDLSALFSLMLDHGGDLLRPDSMGQNCAQIARSFGAKRVLQLLRQ
jgi:ankyrin repeat protein